MLEIWMELPAWQRMIVSLVLMATGGVIIYAWLVGDWQISQYTFLPPLGAGLAALGLMMTAVGGRSRAERNGYHF